MGLDRRNWRKPYTEDELKSMLAAGEMLQLRQRVQDLEEVHRQTVDKGVAGFEALVKRVQELEELLREAYKDADEILRPHVKELEKERDSYKDAAEYNKRRADDAESQRDELLEVVEAAYKVASEHDDRLPFDWAVYCEMLYQTITSVKEKS